VEAAGYFLYRHEDPASKFRSLFTRGRRARLARAPLPEPEPSKT
jgi:hypothetical protein